MDVCRWIVQVVLRPEQTRLAQKRWVVERTFGWLMGSRRLVRDITATNLGDVHLPCHDPLDGEAAGIKADPSHLSNVL